MTTILNWTSHNSLFILIDMPNKTQDGPTVTGVIWCHIPALVFLENRKKCSGIDKTKEIIEALTRK